MRSASDRRGAGYKVSFRTDPSAPAGRAAATVHVSVTDPSGNMVADAAVGMTLVMTAMSAIGMPEMRIAEDLQWNGSDYSKKMNTGMAGSFNVVVEVQRGGQAVAVYRSQLNAK